MKEIVFTRWEDVPVVIDLPYLAIILKLSYVHLTNLCKKGQLPAFKVGDSWRVEKGDLIEWINQKKGDKSAWRR